MGRATIILIVGMGILFAMAGTRMSFTSLDTQTNATNDYSRTMARNIAKSGVELAVMQIDSNRYWRAGYNNLSMSSGSLTLTAATVDSSRVRVRSVGTFNGNSVPITAVIYIPQVFNGAAPPAFSYGLMCDQTLTANGNVNVEPYNVAGGYNANIHANNSINLKGSVLIEGYGTYSVGSVQLTPNKPANFFQPPFPTGGPLTYQVPRISIPWLNVDSLKPFCDEFYNGSLNLSGNKTLGSATNPRKIWVGGDLDISGNVTGYGLFIVKGSVNFNGNVNVNYPPSQTTQNLGIYCYQSVNFKGNVKLVGHILTNQTVNMGGNVELIGGIISQQSINWNGSVWIRYWGATQHITAPIWSKPVDVRPEIVEYWE